jgi:hypothetical protein
LAIFGRRWFTRVNSDIAHHPSLNASSQKHGRACLGTTEA